MKILKLLFIILTVGLMSFVSVKPDNTINQNDDTFSISSANLDGVAVEENPCLVCTFASNELVVRNLYVPRQENFIPILNGTQVKTPCFYSGKYNNNKNIQKNIWLEINDILENKSLTFNNGKSSGVISVPCNPGEII